MIADREVVTGSEYSWAGKLDIRSDVDAGGVSTAWQVAGRPWQADRVYTCDVALVDIDGVTRCRVVELNSFSSAGLYACDTLLVASAVSQAALSEWRGDD